MSSLTRATLAARIFPAAVLLGLGLIFGGAVLQGSLVVAAVVAVASFGSMRQLWHEDVIASVEAAFTAMLAVLSTADPDGISPYLAIPPLVAGLARGRWGVRIVVAIELVVVTLGLFVSAGPPDRRAAADLYLWVLTGAGLGYLGALVRYAGARDVEDHSYRDALGLMRQFQRLSGRLEDGLDVSGIADGVLVEATGALPIEHAVLYTRTHNGMLSPLRYSAGARPVDLPEAEWRAEAGWREPGPHVRGSAVTLPVRQGSEEPIAVLVASCWRPPEKAEVDRAVEAIAPHTVKLAAALLFDEVRGSATFEERQRVAREMHDGVAQDVASLGYLIDMVQPVDDTQATQLGQVRAEVTRVVGELRHSVFEMRNEAASASLGESLSSLAQHIGTTSGLTVHVTLDETETRLRPGVERELLRMAQEAMNNARKHARAENLSVTCRVDPPEATIVISDDGVGLGAGRHDSHGLRIIHERAERIGATVTIETGQTGRGTTVRISLRP